MYTFVLVCSILIGIYVCMYTCIHLFFCSNSDIRICVYVYSYTYICIYMYTYVYHKDQSLWIAVIIKAEDIHMCIYREWIPEPEESRASKAEDIYAI